MDLFRGWIFTYTPLDKEDFDVEERGFLFSNPVYIKISSSKSSDVFEYLSQPACFRIMHNLLIQNQGAKTN